MCESQKTGGGALTLTVMTDEESDLALSVYLAGKVPLPPEISLCDSHDIRRIHRALFLDKMMGIEDHPVALLLRRSLTDTAMASAFSRAPFLSRLSSFSAYSLGPPFATAVETAQPCAVFPGASGTQCREAAGQTVVRGDGTQSRAPATPSGSAQAEPPSKENNKHG